MSLNLEVQESSGISVLKTAGEVDLYSSPQLREALLAMINQCPGAAAVDLSGVPYMDSSGVATLVEGLKAAGQRGKEFRLIAPSPPVLKVLQLSRLDSVFKIDT